jgi:hypothetical protein
MKWAIFTYVGKETRYITRLFKYAIVKISFRTSNALKHLLTPWFNVSKYEQSGTYRLNCQSCPLKYVGQTGRRFKVRFKEHIQAIKGNIDASMFAQHILNTGHVYGCMEDTMTITLAHLTAVHSDILIFRCKYFL